MIAADQPTIFSGVIAGVSSREDGNMSLLQGDADEALKNRKAFLAALSIPIEHTTLLQVTYQDVDNFARYKILTDDYKTEGMLEAKSATATDALVVTKPGHALFLPLADCAGIVLHDPVKDVLMLSHVGRHSAEIDGARLSVEFLQNELGVDPATLKVWVSPAVGKATYPLHFRNGQGLHETICRQLQEAGVLDENIECDMIDTASSKNYFSHSQFLAGSQGNDGRFAVVAMMIEQGEPAA